MQQTKFIVLISLICFVSLLFIQGEVFGAEICEVQAIDCKTVYDPETGTSEWKCAKYEEVCVTVDEGEEEGEEEGDDDKEKGWRCRMDLGGICQEYESTSPKYSTLAACEAKCPYGVYKRCGTAGCETGDCINTMWYIVDPGDQCQVDADCVNGGTPPSEEEPPAVEPPPVSPPPVSPPPVSPPPVSPPPVSPPPTSPSAPKCGIIEFSINGKTNDDRDPLLVWVNASLKGRISTDADCVKCTVESTDTWGNPNPVEYAMTFANNYNIYETFEIPESGTYSFTVTCQGSDPDDIVVDNFSLETIQAINLPWWREIIPVLPGFLRGIFR